ISQTDPDDLFATRFIYSCARLCRRATPTLCACRRRHHRCSGSHLRETVRAIFTRALPRVWSSPRTTQVLIVEDNPDSRETLKRYLTGRNYDVAAAGDLRTGIVCLNKDRFDAIISDIALPDGTGYTLLNEARRRGIHALGIAMSGYPYPSNVNEAGVTGFDYHLTKPVNCDDLLSLLEKSRANEGDAPTNL